MKKYEKELGNKVGRDVVQDFVMTAVRKEYPKIIQLIKKEVFNDIEKVRWLNKKRITIDEDVFNQIKKRHLSTFSKKKKEHN